MKRAISAALAAAILATAGAAFACEGQSVIYEDDFRFADPAWGNHPGVSIADGMLTLLPAEGNSLTLQNQAGFLEGNVDICFDVVQQVEDPSVSFIGLVFGALDYDNYYVLQVSTNGYVNVLRVQKGKWLTPVPWILTEGVVKSGRETNRVRLVNNGNIVTGFVNGQQVVQFRAQLPADGQLFGFYGGISKGQTSFAFDNVKVSVASDAPPAAAPQPPPSSPADLAPPAPEPAPPAPEPAPPAAGAPKPGQPGIPKMPG